MRETVAEGSMSGGGVAKVEWGNSQKASKNIITKMIERISWGLRDIYHNTQVGYLANTVVCWRGGLSSLPICAIWNTYVQVGLKLNSPWALDLEIDQRVVKCKCFVTAAGKSLCNFLWPLLKIYLNQYLQLGFTFHTAQCLSYSEERSKNREWRLALRSVLLVTVWLPGYL